MNYNNKITTYNVEFKKQNPIKQLVTPPKKMSYNKDY